MSTKPLPTPESLSTPAISELYYECHVTIEPVFDARLAEADLIAKKHGFRIADLLMQKRSTDTPERSKHDTFMTGTNVSFSVLQNSMLDLIKELQAAKYCVWRYKIENTIMDSKFCDLLCILKPKELL